jgi:membrane-associated protease RseP (regulator of RpoE activity)
MEPAERSLLYREAPLMPETVYMPVPAQPRQRVWLHVLLFVLTIGTTIFAAGPLFSAGLLLILTAHEFGHYFAARKYNVPVSLPYFIPFPISLFGTLGAFIRMSPRIPHRRALFDIAAAGPIAGLIFAIPVSYLGIAKSTIVQKAALPAHTISLGEPLLFKGLTWILHGHTSANADLLLHPLAFAGWAGMFVTALNLLPISQLDGGHIAYSLSGARSRIVASAMFIGLGVYCLATRNTTWIPLLLLLMFMGVQHPPSRDDGLPIGRTRIFLGALLAVVFVTCFSLVPIKL